MLKKIFVYLTFGIGTFSVSGQTFKAPNPVLKSHETLEITRVENDQRSLRIYMTVENKRAEGGSFCADKNISVIYPDGTKSKLLKSAGIPVCPDTHNFKAAGEKLSFSLEFQPLRKGAEWINIIEECNENCFWFYGVTLNDTLNRRIDELFQKASLTTTAASIDLFRNMLNSLGDRNIPAKALIYINLINASLEEGDKVGASVWYKRFSGSNIPGTDFYLKYLNDKGIKY
jgi:hypothetical protein